MPYLIDGHNLIPKLGLQLSSPEDEQELVSLLLEYCRIRRLQLEVYFDGAPPGQARTRKSGAVISHFVTEKSSADRAIEDRLEQLGRSARNWTVVSSDQRIQRSARAAHAQVIPSEEFARMIHAVKMMQYEKLKTSERGPGPDDVANWLAEFKGRPPRS